MKNRGSEMMNRIATSLAALVLLAGAPALAQREAAAPKEHAVKTRKGAPRTRPCTRAGKLLAARSQKQCAEEGGTWGKAPAAKAKHAKRGAAKGSTSAKSGRERKAS
jgi:hypothetical protein